MAQIHPTAVVDPSAKLADNVVIGPHCVVEHDVEIGAGTRLMANSFVGCYTTMGENNLVYPFATIGSLPPHARGRAAVEADHDQFGGCYALSRSILQHSGEIIGLLYQDTAVEITATTKNWAQESSTPSTFWAKWSMKPFPNWTNI